MADAAMAAGIKPTEVCAYAQNDAYGMAGVQGFRGAGQTARHGIHCRQSGPDPEHAGDNPERNGIGPVGVYPRDTVSARPGYLS